MEPLLWRSEGRSEGYELRLTGGFSSPYRAEERKQRDRKKTQSEEVGWPWCCLRRRPSPPSRFTRHRQEMNRIETTPLTLDCVWWEGPTL